MWVRDRLDGLWRDKDFAGRYPRDGRPGISPAQLATVCVLQFLLGLSDRQAAEAVRCRIDCKYALAMELDDPGFHHSVLADFRERLTHDDRADRLLDLALVRLREAGLVRERTTQRTDSSHVLAAVRDLTRLELVTEAVRAVLEEVSRPAWCRGARPRAGEMCGSGASDRTGSQLTWACRERSSDRTSSRRRPVQLRPRPPLSPQKPESASSQSTVA
ncbi:transposase [Streptomyces sp. NPDC051366]|uniref:transposase n=1 Tax=Streptomyces sp. NPDC051366 TaxID=3365652 RepID=UPI0037BDAB57